MGLANDGEPSFVAAKRELKEEAGLCFSDSQFSEVGRFQLEGDKYIHIYAIICDEFNLAACNCSSMVNIKGKDPFPEVDDFEWVPLNFINKKINNKLYNVLEKVIWKQFNRLCSKK